ncbi:MAG: hypothetical protein ABI570_08035 [Ilumatobacteraceae bacterium]
MAAALCVGGVAAARADTAGSTITVCAQKSSGQMRYSRNGTCRQNEVKLILGKTGPTGDTGATTFKSFDSGSFQHGVLLKTGTDAWVLLLPVPIP